ncbi:MAG: FAD-binding oxidoreductase, partial [Chthoniobacteraceae bacterium]
MKIASQLSRLLGAGIVRTDEATLATHAKDRWFAARNPEAVVLARTRAHVEKTLRFAHRHGIPVTPRGAGVGYVGGCVPARGGIALSVARMKRIKEIHFADGVAVVEPGVITAELQARVRERGL